MSIKDIDPSLPYPNLHIVELFQSWVNNNKCLIVPVWRWTTPRFLQFFFRVHGQFCIWFERMVPNAIISKAFNFSISGIVVSQLSKHKVWYLCWGRCFTNRITEPSEKYFSAPTLPLPLYKKKSYIIPHDLALRNILNAHLTVFLRLNCHILLLFIFEGMICSSTDMTFCLTFRQFAQTIPSNGRILNSLSCLF